MILHRNWWGRFPIPDVAHLLSLDKSLRLRIGVAEPFPFELEHCLAFNGELPRDVLVLERRWSFDSHDLVLLGLLVLLLLAVDFLSNHTDSWSAGIPIHNFHISH